MGPPSHEETLRRDESSCCLFVELESLPQATAMETKRKCLLRSNEIQEEKEEKE